MEVNQTIRKFFNLILLYIGLALLVQVIFSFIEDEKSTKENHAGQLVENFNHLVFRLSTYHGDQKDFRDMWDAKIGTLQSSLQAYPALFEISRDLTDLNEAVTRNISDSDKIAVPTFNRANLPLINDIFNSLSLFSKETSADLIHIRQFNLAGQASLLLLLITGLSFYFLKYVRNTRETFHLLKLKIDTMPENHTDASSTYEDESKEIPEYRAIFSAISKAGQQFRDLNERNRELQKILMDFKNKKNILNDVIENLPVGFVVSNVIDKKVLLANKELVDIYGFRPEYLDELNPLYISPQDEEVAKEKGYPEDISPADILMPQEKKAQIIFNQRGQYQTVDLKRIPFKKQGVLVTLVTNVSELTEKEEELAASERLSRFIFDTAEVGLSLVDENGFIVRVNKTYCIIYGYQEEELIGQHFTILLPPNKKDHFKQAYQGIMKKRASQATPLHEVQVVKKTGEVLDVITTSRTVFDHHFHGTIYSVLDVTEVRTSSGKLEAAIEGGRLGTWNVNMETGYNDFNDYWAEMLGYKKSEVPPSKDFFDKLIHPDDELNFKREIEKINKGIQNSIQLEIRLRCKDGSYKWVLDSGKVIKWNSEGKPYLMAGCHIDIDEMKKAQFEVITNSDRLRRAQEMGMLGDWELEVPTGSFSCSAMIFRIFGKRKENHLLYEEFLSQFHSTSAIKLKNEIQNAIENQRSFSHEAKVFLENGTLKYLKVIAVPILGFSGKVVKVSGILQDVTSIKTTRETLEETTKRLQALSDNIPGGLVQFKVSPQFPPQILYLSRGAEKIWGVSRDEALEGDMFRLLQYVHPNDLNIIKRSLQVATQKLKRVNIIWRTVSKSGELKWHHGIGIPTKNSDNTVTWNALVLDITDRKVSENKIREQEEYMQVLTQYASDAIIACDKSGRIRFVNETLRKWLGPLDPKKSPEEWSRFYHLYSIEDDRYIKPSELSLFKALETGDVVNQEFIIKHPTKKVRYVQSNGSALYDSSGNRIGAMVVLRDMTERVQKEIEVSNAIIKAREKERSKIASEIHDGITQSLSVVAMNMKNLRFDYEELETSENYEKALKYLQAVIEQSRGLAHEIMPNSIHDFGLIEAVQELVEQCAMGSKMEIKFEYTGYGRVAAGKELHIFRVIQEGLGNALKHSKADKILIRLHFGKNHIRVTLKDDGKGFDIKKSYLQQGIGLLSMRDRIKKLQGRFRIFSGKKGTIVWLKVPVKTYLKDDEIDINIYS